MDWLKIIRTRTWALALIVWQAPSLALPMLVWLAPTMAMALLMSVAPTPALAQGRPAAVAVDEVVDQKLTQTAPTLGRLVTKLGGPIAARVAGPVLDVPLLVGDRVEAGDIIAQLDDATLVLDRDLRTAEVRQARAAVSRAQGRLQNANSQLARIERLRGSSSFTQQRFDDATLEVIEAEADVQEGNAQVQRAQVQLARVTLDIERTQIRAPFGGVITERAAQPGMYVSVGTTIARLVDDTHLEVEVDVPVDRLSGLIVGRAIAAQINNPAREIFATVRAIVPEEDPFSRTRAVRLSLPATMVSGLAINQSVTVLVPVGEPRIVTTVHKDAVIAQGSSRIVFVAAQGAAERREIQLGIADGNRFEVVSGLTAGELTVVRGNERLRPGQRLRYPGAPQPQGAQGQGNQPQGAQGQGAQEQSGRRTGG
mgnify:CR=1 FL=1